MGVLVLRNHNPDAALQQLQFDLKTGHFLTPSKEKIRKQDLASGLAFTHPILDETPLVPIAKNQYVYHYHNEETFCLALRYAYATFLSAKNPALCAIKMQPSEQYFHDAHQFKVYFSPHPQKAATQQLTVRQLNAMLTELYGQPFQYCNHNVLEKTLYWRDFSMEMDADKLYLTNHLDLQKTDHQACLDRYELRFMNTQIGFGLFARYAIQTGEVVAQYCGEYVSKRTKYKNYCYIPNKTCSYNLLLDAHHIGNIARFVNHGPEPDSQTHPGKYLTANVDVKNHRMYGTSRIVLIASRDIQPGEQILSSYGRQYFRVPDSSLQMKKNGAVFTSKQKRVQDSAIQLKQYLFVFAQYGIKRAQWMIIRKPLLVLLLCIGLGLWLQ